MRPRSSGSSPGFTLAWATTAPQCGTTTKPPPLASSLDLAGELGSVKRSTAAIHLELGDLGRARTDAREALRIHREAGAPFDELDDHLLLAEIEARAGRAGDAARSLAAARPIAKTLGARSATVAVALTTAQDR